MNKNASKEILLSVIGIVILIIAVVGVSFAYFNYAREGTKINKVNIAKVAFLYKEDETLGNGISLKDVLPIADVEGQSSQDHFDFTITADAKEAPITYDIVITEDETSTLDNSVVKIYLVKIEDAKEVPVVGPIKCSELDNYSETASKISGKLVFNVSAVDENNYKQQYRLRMWIAEDAILYEEKDGVIIKDLINKTFSIKVNVFARNINTVQ